MEVYFVLTKMFSDRIVIKVMILKSNNKHKFNFFTPQEPTLFYSQHVARGELVFYNLTNDGSRICSWTPICHVRRPSTLKERRKGEREGAMFPFGFRSDKMGLTNFTDFAL